MKVHVCGVDIGKTVFHLVGLSKEGHIVTKKRFNRKQLLTHTVNMPTCLIGIEACPGAHFLARALLQQGHDVKLMPAKKCRHRRDGQQDCTDGVGSSDQRPIVQRCVQHVRKSWKIKNDFPLSLTPATTGL